MKAPLKADTSTMRSKVVFIVRLHMIMVMLANNNLINTYSDVENVAALTTRKHEKLLYIYNILCINNYTNGDGEIRFDFVYVRIYLIKRQLKLSVIDEPTRKVLFVVVAISV
jgi:hypothetical protein